MSIKLQFTVCVFFRSSLITLTLDMFSCLLAIWHQVCLNYLFISLVDFSICFFFSYCYLFYDNMIIYIYDGCTHIHKHVFKYIVIYGPQSEVYKISMLYVFI